MSRLHAALWICLTVIACGKTEDPPVRRLPPPPPPPPAMDAASPPLDASELAPVVVPVTAPARRLWTDKLEAVETFDAYSKELGGERFVKFVVDLKSNAIYYFDVGVYPVHKDFVFQELYKKPKTKDAVRVFDKNYTANKTDFMMCYLVHHTSQDVWTFAFWDGDLATATHVTRAYKRLKETFFLADKVKFRPDSSYQEKVAKKLRGVPFILNDQLYQAATYHAFNEGTAVGTLRIVPPTANVETLTFRSDEIVVLTAPLPDITPVAGIISETFSTPLAHVSLRARAWGIPNIGLREARAKHGELDGKRVFLEAKGGSYVLREPTLEEIAAHTTKAHKQVVVPVADLSIDHLATLDEMRATDIDGYGAKAVNLGEIRAARLTGFEIPPGFGVPYRYYAAHLESNQLDATIAAVLAEPAFVKDGAVRKKKLAELKQAIMDAPASDDLRTKITAALAALPGAGGGVFVRSSGNAEDLDDFSGAGLYDTVPNMRGTDDVVDAIKRVWASTFNYAAFEDRQRAGIEPLKVFSAVLIQIAVPATSAGVLVTRHPTDPTDDKNYTINAKSGLGMSVVDGKQVPDSLIVSWYNHGIRILSRSAEPTKLVFDDKGGIREVPNPDIGTPVLTNAMVLLLADSARKITKVFKNDRLDIEWLFVDDKLFIVQTRPLVGTH